MRPPRGAAGALRLAELAGVTTAPGGGCVADHGVTGVAGLLSVVA
ncbi:MAG: hypothetical protein ACRDSZ_23015 [Pseudonocardiaceae bacterium]